MGVGVKFGAIYALSRPIGSCVVGKSCGDFPSYLVEVIVGYTPGYRMRCDNEQCLAVAAGVADLCADGHWGELDAGY